jgi:hypothetical protein
MFPILSYGAPVCIVCLTRNNNATKLKRIQRIINIKIAKAFRATSYEALSILIGITPILIELGSRAKFYNITRGNERDGLYDAPKYYRKWTHPAEAIEIKEK